MRRPNQVGQAATLVGWYDALPVRRDKLPPVAASPGGAGR
jgi:hypothetical protein